MAIKGYVLDGGGPKDSENTHNSFLTKRDEDAFWQIGTDMSTFAFNDQNCIAESKPLNKPRKKNGTTACPKKKRYNVDPTGLDPEEVAKKRAIVGFDRSKCPACGKDCSSTKKAFQMHVKHEGPHHRYGQWTLVAFSLKLPLTNAL